MSRDEAAEREGFRRRGFKTTRNPDRALCGHLTHYHHRRTGECPDCYTSANPPPPLPVFDDPRLNEPIQELEGHGVCQRVMGALELAGIMNVGMLVSHQKEDLLQMPNLDRCGVNELIAAAREYLS